MSKFCLAAEVPHDNQKMNNVTSFDTRNRHSALALDHSLYTVFYIVLLKGALGGEQMAKCQNFTVGMGNVASFSGRREYTARGNYLIKMKYLGGTNEKIVVKKV